MDVDTWKCIASLNIVHPCLEVKLYKELLKKL